MSSRFFLYTPALCAAALLLTALLLPGCGGTVPMDPTASALRSGQTAVQPRQSWMTPEAKRGDLLYVSEYGGGVVDVFSYPHGQLVGELTNFFTPIGECLDKRGDVFIVNANINHGNPSIQEFAHGGTTMLESLSDPDEEPYACAVDRRSGDLAVTDQFGGISIYQNAQGSPTILRDPYMDLALWVGYDNQGDLFVDGLNAKIDTELDELPQGKKAWSKLTLSAPVGFPGEIQWDGSHITMGDDQYQSLNTSAIDQLQISGLTATILSTTVLSGSVEAYGTWIQGNRVVVPEESRSDDAVDVWHYPAGGSAIKSLDKSFNGPVGAVVSPAH